MRRRTQDESTQELRAELAVLRQELAAITARVDAFETIEAEMHRSTSRLRAEGAASSRRLEEFWEALNAHVQGWVGEALEGFREQQKRVVEQSISEAADKLERRVRRLERHIQHVSASGGVLPEISGTTAEQPSVTPVDAGIAPSATTDLSYASFEEQLRGSSDLVAKRQEVYLPYFESLPHGDWSVLDIGCGRGEFVKLLKSRGIASCGIDLNLEFVADCREDGLDVLHGDGIAHLESLSSGSLSGVTAFHVVEHLPMELLQRLLVATHRVVMNGGILVLETPNPENLDVGANTFWLDPTHLRPIPPRLLEFLVESAGFENVEILRLHPDEMLDDEGPASTLSSAIHGPRDYAVVARNAKSS